MSKKRTANLNLLTSASDRHYGISSVTVVSWNTHTHTLLHWFCALLQITQLGQLNMHVNPINRTTTSSQLTATARAHVHMAKAPERQHIRLVIVPSSVLFLHVCQKGKHSASAVWFPPTPAASHYVITVVHQDRGWVQVLHRGHLTAPTPPEQFSFSSFICQCASSYVCQTRSGSTGLS